MLVYNTIMHCFAIVGVMWLQILSCKAFPGPEPNDGARVKRGDELTQVELDILIQGLESVSPLPVDESKIDEKSNGNSRIVGGQDAKKNEFPSAVLLIWKGYKACAGTIIDKDWVMSAAHCLMSNNPSEFKFWAGKHDWIARESANQEVKATLIVKHKDYTTKPHNVNDIVLFKVTPSFKFDKFVEKANLPTKGFKPTKNAVAVGWGQTSQGGKSARILQKVVLPVLTNDKCIEKYGNGHISPTNICAGFDKGGKDTCQGDSGGPLYFMDGKKQIVIGVVSWGAGCAKPDKPGVYTRVTEYLDWISSNTKVPVGRGIAGVVAKDDAEESSNGSEGPDSGQISLSNALAQIVCKGYKEHTKDKQLAPAVKTKPKTAGKCGWFSLSRCSDEEACNPFKIWMCKT